MSIASRTPEGEPNRCEICGHELRIEPTPETHDGVCPHCGSLLWFWFSEIDVGLGPTPIDPMKLRDQVFGRAIAKFGSPLPLETVAGIVGLLPDAEGATWLNALQVAESWDEFVILWQRRR